jgi:hypothetical protein
MNVKIWDIYEFTCSNCCCINKEPIEIVYEDEIESKPNVIFLLAELSLTQITNNDHQCISVYKKILNAFKELINNADAYEEFKSEIENVKTFLWGIKLAIENYPEGKICFTK